MESKQIGRRFAITLVAEASPDDDAAIRRLRALLKLLGRTYRLRCTDAREITDRSDESDKGAPI